jgi:hypothetical protein
MRITEIIGYSAETSGPNEKPRWGHFTANYVDGIQPRFDNLLAQERSASYHRGIRDAVEALQSVVPYNFELNYDGTEDKLRAAYVEGVHDSWATVRAMLDADER